MRRAELFGSMPMERNPPEEVTVGTVAPARKDTIGGDATAAITPPLSAEDVERFKRDGYMAPLPALTESEVRHLRP